MLFKKFRTFVFIVKNIIRKNFIKNKCFVKLIFATIHFGCTNKDSADISNLKCRNFETSSITQNSAIITANVNSNGKNGILSRGICINTTGNPTINDSKIEAPVNAIGSYSSILK